MNNPDSYEYEFQEYETKVDRIIRHDQAVPGSGHRDEDRLMERFVRDVAWGGMQKNDPRAMALVKLLDSPRRRWYA